MTKQTATAKRSTRSTATAEPAESPPARPYARKRPARVHRLRPDTAAPAVTPEQRRQMIAEAAYRLAEQDGFDPGRSLDHWLEAEALIEARLGGPRRA
ncbi:MAG TPA: DUF2934 domain-containing protein [Gammaproteobacteria bacterium]|nr:DUF2934 domain-containing protein [Gammaproteobacteria bacterium]